jgi:hypothetical protein
MTQLFLAKLWLWSLLFLFVGFFGWVIYDTLGLWRTVLVAVTVVLMILGGLATVWAVDVVDRNNYYGH